MVGQAPGGLPGTGAEVPALRGTVTAPGREVAFLAPGSGARSAIICADKTMARSPPASPQEWVLRLGLLQARAVGAISAAHLSPGGGSVSAEETRSLQSGNLVTIRSWRDCPKAPGRPRVEGGEEAEMRAQKP